VVALRSYAHNSPDPFKRGKCSLVLVVLDGAYEIRIKSKVGGRVSSKQAKQFKVGVKIGVYEMGLDG
jgi:hypothetical protein